MIQIAGAAALRGRCPKKSPGGRNRGCKGDDSHLRTFSHLLKPAGKRHGEQVASQFLNPFMHKDLQLASQFDPFGLGTTSSCLLAQIADAFFESHKSCAENTDINTMSDALHLGTTGES